MVLNALSSHSVVIRVMQRWLRSLLVGYGGLLLISSSLPAWGTAENLPNCADVVKKVVQRSKWSKSRDFQRLYSYLKITRTEDLDSDGKVVKQRAKSVQVFPGPNGGSPVKVAVTNRLLSQEELKRVAAQREEDSDREPKKRSSQPKIELDEEIISRFDFTVVDRKVVAGRSTLVLEFAPKAGSLPVHQIQDRLLNEAIGTVWVDEREYEVVRADIRLREPVNITGGIVGAVQTFHFVMERTRVEPGVWLLRQTDLFIRGRQFLSPIHTRKQEYWSDFKKPTA